MLITKVDNKIDSATFNILIYSMFYSVQICASPQPCNELYADIYRLKCIICDQCIHTTKMPRSLEYVKWAALRL